PTTAPPTARTRSARPRSAVTTTRPRWRSAMVAIVSSPTPGACTTATPSTSDPSAPPRPRPSSTTVTGGLSRPATTADRTVATKSRVAPGRSRHQPVGREPITLAASTTSTSPASRVGDSSSTRRALHHHLAEVLLDELDGHAALADGSGNALHGPRPDVADSEHAGEAGLEEERVRTGGASPTPFGEHRRRDVVTCANEAVPVALHAPGKPVGVRRSPDHDEQIVGADLDALGRRSVLEDKDLEPLVALGCTDLAVGAYRDARFVLDAVEEVGRHRFRERGAADHDHHVVATGREGGRRLPGG